MSCLQIQGRRFQEESSQLLLSNVADPLTISNILQFIKFSDGSLYMSLQPSGHGINDKLHAAQVPAPQSSAHPQCCLVARRTGGVLSELECTSSQRYWMELAGRKIPSSKDAIFYKAGPVNLAEKPRHSLKLFGHSTSAGVSLSKTSCSTA